MLEAAYCLLFLGNWMFQMEVMTFLSRVGVCFLCFSTASMYQQPAKRERDILLRRPTGASRKRLRVSIVLEKKQRGGSATTMKKHIQHEQ